MKQLALIFLLALEACAFAQPSKPNINHKYEKWQNPSYFRGYNILYEAQHTLQDFIDFKNYGGNLFMIGTRGFMNEDSPYDTIQASITGTDLLVNYCRQTGIHYVIAVRSGPGAYDTYKETSGQTGESRIWYANNTSEQDLYAGMLKMIVSRYSSDTLFAGINLVVEPRPKVTSIPTNNSATYKMLLEAFFNIHMDQVYSKFVREIRTVDGQIPIILENFAYSTAELFPPYVINNTYLVYSAHNYQPVEFSKAQVPFSVSYPGVYWNITTLAQMTYDSAFIRDVVLKKVTDFKQTAGAPVFLGEFGMFLPQIGGGNYMRDMLKTCTDNGIHFALWDWRRGSGQNWNVEAFSDTDHVSWKKVLSCFNAPPVPSPLLPALNSEVPDLNPEFAWDSLTAFTVYDVYIIDSLGTSPNTFYDMPNSHWKYDGPTLREGTTYFWKVRAKNPGGMPENASAWSNEGSFRTPGLLAVNQNQNIPVSYALYQNYPNPFNPVTHIKFDLPRSSDVNIVLYDITGRIVKDVYSAYTNAGKHDVAFDGSMLSSGVYFYRITAGDFNNVRKMMLIK